MVPLKISKTRSRVAVGLILLAHMDLVLLFLTEHTFISFGDPRPLLVVHAGVLIAFALLVALADRRKVW